MNDEDWARQATAWRDAGWNVDVDTEPSKFAAYDAVDLEAPGINVYAWVSQVHDEVIVMGRRRREIDWAEFVAMTTTPAQARRVLRRRG